MWERNIKVSQLLDHYPTFVMKKDKIDLDEKFDFIELEEKLRFVYKSEKIDDRDGIKIQFEDSWIHIRKSNTEPIVRIYTEAKSESDCKKIITDFKKLIS